MANFFSVKNFERFQHYKDRAPPWIKLYGEMLENYEFGILADHVKGQLMSIWLLASRMDNKIPFDSAWVANKINATGPVDLDALMGTGFIVDYSEAEAKGKLENWPSRYIPDETKASVMKRDRRRCVQCDARKNLEIDHIVPISAGGSSILDNLQVLCRSCNRRKRATLRIEPTEQVATQKHLSHINPRSLEREGETEREAKKNSKQARKDARVSDSLFDKFWKAYPRRDGANPKQPALKIFSAAVKSGHDPSRIIAGAERYRADLRAKGNEGTPYVAQAMTWLRQARWDDEQPGNGHDTGPSIEMKQRTWRALLKSERETGLWQSQNVSKADIPAAFIAEFEATE